MMSLRAAIVDVRRPTKYWIEPRVVDWMWTAKFKPAREAKNVWTGTTKCEPRSANREVRNAVESWAENREVRSTKYKVRIEKQMRTKCERRSANREARTTNHEA